MLLVNDIRKNALAALDDPHLAVKPWRCAKDVIELLEEVAVLRAKLEAKDAEIASIWRALNREAA